MDKDKKDKKGTPSSTMEQRMKGMLKISSGIVLGIGLAYASFYHLKWPIPASLSLTVRLAYTIRHLFFAVLTVFFGVVGVASTRFRTAAMNPLLKSAQDVVEVHQRYLQNTLEQFVIFAVLLLSNATYMKEEHIALIPTATLLFIVGRVLFWIGYTIHWSQRSYGMAINFLVVGLLIIHGVSLFFSNGLENF